MSNLPLRPNVCMLVFNHQKKLWLGERLGEPGTWQFPQGGVEQGMSLEDNVRRELEEELGIQSSHIRITTRLTARNDYNWGTVPAYAVGKWRGQSQSFWLVEFLGSDSEINVNTAHPEFSAWRWCTIEEVYTLAEPKRVPGYRPALEEARILLIDS